MLDKTVRRICTFHEDRRCLTITAMRGEMATRFLHKASCATMHYISRCEEFVLASFLNNLQKNIKKSLAQEVCQKRKYFGKWNMFLFYKIEKTVISERTVKNCFGGTFDHFFGEGDLPPPPKKKINVTFLPQIKG